MPSGFKVHTYFPIVVPYSQVYGRVFPYASLGIFCEFMTEQIRINKEKIRVFAFINHFFASSILFIILSTLYFSSPVADATFIRSFTRPANMSVCSIFNSARAL